MILWKAQLHRMLRDLIKILLCTVLIVSLSGCKDSYKVQDYLEDLALTTGIGDDEKTTTSLRLSFTALCMSLAILVSADIDSP